MLDDFSAVAVDPKKSTAPPPTTKAESEKEPTTAKGPEAPPNPEDALSEEEFAKQLQAGMADLLGELEKSVSFVR